MTLGCGSWGGNVTSDNVSPLHLMDIKRVAFEVRPVASKRPAVAAQPSAMASPPVADSRPAAPITSGATPKVSREEIAAIVDRFLANREPESAPPPAPAPAPADYSRSSGGNGGTSRVSANAGSAGSANGRKAAEFVSEDDVRRAIQKGEKIYVGPRTIITPSARDIGDPAEVFAKA
jgi:acetaldehyde dehydrogenase (acetylating)